MIYLIEAIAAAKLGRPLAFRGTQFDLIVDFPAVSVRDNRTNRLVAHSSMKADFEASLEEFAADYLPEASS